MILVHNGFLPESDNRKLLRQAFLSKMSTAKSPRSAPVPRGSSKRAHLSSSLQEHNASPDSSSSGYVNRRSESVTPLSALLSAIVDLPGEYAAVRNVLRELKSRVGSREWQAMSGASAPTGDADRNGRWAIIDGGAGSGLWYVHSSMHLLDRADSCAWRTQGSARYSRIFTVF